MKLRKWVPVGFWFWGLGMSLALAAAETVPLVARFDFDENSGSFAGAVAPGNSGLGFALEKTVSWEPGRSGSALRFHGKKGFGTLSAAIPLAPDGGDFTIQADICSFNAGTTQQILNAGGWLELEIRRENGTLRLNLLDASGKKGQAVTYETQATVADGRVHRIAIIREKGMMRFYIDGTLDLETPDKLDNLAVTIPAGTTIGGKSNNTEVLDGWIDNLAFYSSAIAVKQEVPQPLQIEKYSLANGELTATFGVYRNKVFLDRLYDEKLKLELADTNPLVYVHGGYYGLGEKIGKFGWSVEKKKK